MDPAKFPSIRWINRSQAVPSSPYGPFTSKATYLLCEWFYNSANTKSLQDFDALVGALTTEGFKTADLNGFRAQREMQHLDNWVNPSGIFSQEDGWHEGAVEIPLPKRGVHHAAEGNAPKFRVEGLHFRDLLEVILSEVQDARFASQRHWFPHELYWFPHELYWNPASPSNPSTASNSTPEESMRDQLPPQPTGPDAIRIYSEMYNSDAMNRAQADLRKQPRLDGDAPSIEYAILPILLWSDATLLALFGSAKLWPIYLYIGNISKYVRGLPTEFVAQHLAYVPMVCLLFSLVNESCN
ncbi:hypothetical protein BD413DRAFT_488665 [Trametes elegans]|nr:hypothetical protein BD413DRAFT_488665 [Trametes elegans]